MPKRAQSSGDARGALPHLAIRHPAAAHFHYGFVVTPRVDGRAQHLHERAGEFVVMRHAIGAASDIGLVKGPDHFEITSRSRLAADSGVRSRWGIASIS